MNYFKDIDELPTHLLDEIANFLEGYKTLEGKHTIIQGYQSKETAIKIINKCLENYKKKYK